MISGEKRLTYVEDVIALFEEDITNSRDALKTSYLGDKAEIRAEMNGVRAALSMLKHHASHGGTVDAVEVVHGEWVWKDLCGDGSFALCCSVCLGTDGARETAHYCPNCGAWMDGDPK